MPCDARSIRAACRDGLLLHDSMNTSVELNLGGRDHAPDPHPEELARALCAARARGMRPNYVALCMRELLNGDDPVVREQQILAVLSSLAGLNVDILDFHSHPHLTPAVASAAASLAPTELHLSYHEPPPRAAQIGGGSLPLRDTNTYAAFELLSRCLPRLRELSLIGVTHWPVFMLHSLHLGSRLTALYLDMYETEGHSPTSTDLQSCLHAVSGLTQLKLFQFESSGSHVNRHFPHKPDACNLDLACLASLTALTTLSLNLEVLYQEDNTWGFARQPREVRQRWAAAWERQRAGLAAALRAMPALCDLRVIGMQLSVRGLSALTALKSLTLQGLLLSPPLEMDAAGAARPLAAAAAAAPADLRVAAAGGASRRWPLPPRLRQLRIMLASPTVLGSLVRPANLTVVGMFGPSRISFLPLDLHTAAAGVAAVDGDAADGAPPPGQPGPGPRWPQLSPAAIGAFRSAVHLLRGCLLTEATRLWVTADGARGALRPPPPPLLLPAAEAEAQAPAAAAAADGGGASGGAEGAAVAAPLGGHAAWLCALAPLQLQALHLENIHLERADIVCIATSLGDLTELDLGSSEFPPEALLALTALRRLTALTFTWASGAAEYGTWGVAAVVKAVLLRLARGAPSLATVRVHPPQQSYYAATCRPVIEAVQAVLTARGSRVRVSLE
ncbi:hypothetical protein PLESTF_000199600 [Pleodorina starrii]|nr:hypothetical protein PLESTM_000235500 [Pleodorina starrii]GLC64714.1 hypothetical protein PLESTF_000199600 [Pleodorina starrii]